MPRVKEEAKRALALDATLGAAHHSLAWVKLLHEWGWEGTEREFLRALELEHGSAVIRSQYAFFIPQMLHGRHEDAIAERRRGLEADPLSGYLRATVSLVLTVAGKHEEGLNLAKEAVSIEPTSFMARRCGSELK